MILRLIYVKIGGGIWQAPFMKVACLASVLQLFTSIRVNPGHVHFEILNWIYDWWISIQLTRQFLFIEYRTVFIVLLKHSLINVTWLICEWLD